MNRQPIMFKHQILDCFYSTLPLSVNIESLRGYQLKKMRNLVLCVNDASDNNLITFTNQFLNDFIFGPLDYGRPIIIS